MRNDGCEIFCENNLFIHFLGIMAMALVMNSCEPKNQDNNIPNGPDHLTDFPTFITPNEKYFDVRSNGIPDIDPDSYQLKISGAINEPATFTLEDLRNLDMFEKTITIECIGNRTNGDLIGTATWKGFRVYDLLKDLGIKDGVSAVNYHCADGYFTYNTLDELKNKEVLGALFMNGKPIPALYGFPLRIIFPGYYGVRQPGWITEMELVVGEGEDYSSRYKTDSSIAIDSKIFFPVNNETYIPGESIIIGGAAYGGKRISSVEITGDDGNTWIPANIKDSLDQDYTWIFWEVSYTPQSTGTITIRARATTQDGRVQPREEDDIYDGINSWPTVTISVE
jgi:DMSO/TMAO reductase YedYZ molybdopterin-dependent catalytic subunit